MNFKPILRAQEKKGSRITTKVQKEKNSMGGRYAAYIKMRRRGILHYSIYTVCI